MEIINTIPHRRTNGREPPKPTTITVHSGSTLTVTSCAGIVDDVIKYVLYQRGQIPVPLEALVREAKWCRQALDADQHTQQDQKTPLDPVSRKKELMKRKLQRKWQQWLNKADKFLQNYNSMRESMHKELTSGNVRCVCIVLGSSIMTGKERYIIRLPEDYTGQPSEHLPKAQNIRMELFRAIVTNEEMLKQVNRPCSVQRIWVLVQKYCNLPYDIIDSAVPADTTSFSKLIPRPEFSQNPQAMTVEINVQHTRVTASMDLTPTVGSGIKSQSNILFKNGISKSMYQNSPSIFYLSSKKSYHNTQYCSFEGHKECVLGSTTAASDTTDKKSTLPSSLNYNSDLTYRRSISETPEKIMKNEVITIVETPVQSSVHHIKPLTPSKQLASRLRTFNLSEAVKETAWYQVDSLISGFRDMWPKTKG